MTSQQIYDKVKKHLLKQGRKSMLLGTCMYRGPNGTKCAIGAIIPDRLYSQDMEGAGTEFMGDASRNNSGAILESVLAQIGVTDILLAIDLQNTHDSSDSNGWQLELTAVAEKHGLRP